MTSSLVGSEMCIRDSVKDTPMLEEQHVVSVDDSEEDNEAGAHVSTPNVSCLLYTSDAADDM
eukprot:1612194-Prorocentrum_lima.AAC.1